MKKAILQQAVSSILEDLERLTMSDREQYVEQHKSFFELAMQDLDCIDFGKFDLDKLIDEQRQLIKSLQRRDEMWFGDGR